MSILKKLHFSASSGLLVLLCMSCVVVAVAGAAWQTHERMAVAIDGAGAIRVTGLMRLNWIETNVTRLSLQLFHASKVGSPSMLEKVLTELEDKQLQIRETLRAMEAAVTTPNARAASRQLNDLSQLFLTVIDANVRLIREARAEEARAYLLTQTMPVRNRLLVVLMQERQRQHAVNEANRPEFTQAQGLSNRQLGVLAVIVSVALTACYWLVAELVYRWNHPAWRLLRPAWLQRCWYRLHDMATHWPRSTS